MSFWIFMMWVVGAWVMGWCSRIAYDRVVNPSQVTNGDRNGNSQ